MSVIVYILTL